MPPRLRAPDGFPRQPHRRKPFAAGLNHAALRLRRRISPCWNRRACSSARLFRRDARTDRFSRKSRRIACHPHAAARHGRQPFAVIRAHLAGSRCLASKTRRPSFCPRAPRPHRRFLARAAAINPSARPLHRNALTGRPSCKTRAASPKAVAAHPNAATISPALQRRTSPRVCFSLPTPPRPRKSTRRPRGHTFPERNAFAPRPSAAFKERALAEKEF